jgi:catechol 2,3-dioxygenase-like lactoylglutathione lyase family enzyme
MPRPLPITAINHLSVLTRKVAESTAFYRDVLGFRPVERPPFSFDGAWLHNFGITIHLIRSEQAKHPTEQIDTRDYHLALDTDDLEAVASLLREHGIRFKENEVPGTRTKQLFFQDPDGNHIEVGHYPPTPKYLET